MGRWHKGCSCPHTCNLITCLLDTSRCLGITPLCAGSNRCARGGSQGKAKDRLPSTAQTSEERGQRNCYGDTSHHHGCP